MTSSSETVTQWLQAWSQGDQSALEQLVPVVQAELHHLAQHYLQRERQGHTLQPSALVNEAFLRLLDQPATWQNRAHFFGIAAQLMRRVLVEHARHKNAAKRGGDWERISLAEVNEAASPENPDLIALDDALNSLATFDPRQRQVVELRYFGGLTIEETAEVLSLSPATVEREWSLARAWLRRELSNRK